MEEAIKQIGERLKGLRDVLDIPAEEVAELCGFTVDNYLKMESGEGELSVSSLQKISKRYGIALDVLLFGEEPHMSTYFLTRKGQGMSVERRSIRVLPADSEGDRPTLSWWKWNPSRLMLH